MVEEVQGLRKKQKISERYKSKRRLNKWEKFVYRAVYFVGVFGLIMTTPQILKIWVEKNAAGVSVISWSAYLFVAIFWIIYGIVDRDRPIIFIYSMWVVLDIFIVVGIIMYG